MQLFPAEPSYTPVAVPGPVDAAQFAEVEPQPVDTPDRVRWLGRQIRAIRHDRDTTLQAFQAEITRLQERASALTARADAELARLEAELVGYHRARARDGGPRTVDLPAGRLSGRRPPPRLVITDPDAFCEWAMLNGHDVVTVTPAKAKANTALAGLVKLAVMGMDAGDPDLLDEPVTWVPAVSGEGLQVATSDGVTIDAAVPGVEVVQDPTAWRFSPTD